MLDFLKQEYLLRRVFVIFKESRSAVKSLSSSSETNGEIASRTFLVSGNGDLNEDELEPHQSEEKVRSEDRQEEEPSLTMA